MTPAIPNCADHGKSAMPMAARTRPATTIGSRPRPAAAERSDAAPVHGTRKRSSTLSIAITAPMTVRWSPRASRTSGGTKVLSSGPVTPAKSPPSPTHRQTPHGARVEGAAGASAITMLSLVTPQYCDVTTVGVNHSGTHGPNVPAGRRIEPAPGFSLHASHRGGAGRGARVPEDLAPLRVQAARHAAPRAVHAGDSPWRSATEPGLSRAHRRAHERPQRLSILSEVPRRGRGGSAGERGPGARGSQRHR